MDSLQSIGRFLGGLYVVILVVGQTMTEPLVVDPLFSEAEVEHREGGVPCHLLVHFEELWQPVVELLVRESRVGLQQHQPVAPRVAGLFVYVQLEVLVVIHETSPRLVHCEVSGVLLVEEVGVLPVVDGSLHLDDLPPDLLPDGVDVGELAQPAALPQSALHGPAGGLQVVVGHLQIKINSKIYLKKLLSPQNL